MNAQKYFVTGAHGLLGAAVCKRLDLAGIDYVSPTRSELDLLDKIAIANYISLHKPTHVVHLASKVYGLQGNLNNQFSTLTYNTTINDNVFSALINSSVKKVFFAGTVASYPYPYVSLPLKESDMFKGLPHNGEYGYAVSKNHAFHYLDLMRKSYGIEYVYGLLTNMYGPNDKFDVVNGHVVPSLIRKAHSAAFNNGELEVWGQAETTRDFLHVEDAAAAILMLCEFGSGLCNIASGVAVTMGGLAQAVCDAARISKPIKWLSDKPVGIPHREVDVGKLREIGFVPSYSLADGVMSTYQWFVENHRHARLGE